MDDDKQGVTATESCDTALAIINLTYETEQRNTIYFRRIFLHRQLCRKMKKSKSSPATMDIWLLLLC